MSYHRASDEAVSWLCEIFFKILTLPHRKLIKPIQGPVDMLQIKNSF